MFANASSVSSTVTASRASAAASPAAATAAGTSTASERPRATEEDAEDEHPRAGDEVADAGADERGAAVAREAGVVGDEGCPRDRDRDHEVDAEPDGVPPSPGRPQFADVRLGQRPPGQVEQRGEDRPDRVLADEPADDADGPTTAMAAATAPNATVHTRCLEAEQLVGERRRGCGDHDQLEGRPAEALGDVERRRPVRPLPAERRADEHHRGHARVRADRPAAPSIRLPITLPRTIASRASGKDRAGTRNAAATSTSSDTPRFDQSSVVSSKPSTRRRSGTGSMPQLGVRSPLPSLRRPDPDQVRRVCSQPLVAAPRVRESSGGAPPPAAGAASPSP